MFGLGKAKTFIRHFCIDDNDKYIFALTLFVYDLCMKIQGFFYEAAQVMSRKVINKQNNVYLC